MNFTPLCIFITERDEVKNKVTKMFPLSGYGKRCSWSSKHAREKNMCISTNANTFSDSFEISVKDILCVLHILQRYILIIYTCFISYKKATFQIN